MAFWERTCKTSMDPQLLATLRSEAQSRIDRERRGPPAMRSILGSVPDATDTGYELGIHLHGLQGTWHRLWAMICLAHGMDSCVEEDEGVALVRQQFEQLLGRALDAREWSALVAAGALDFSEALKLVRKRGRYMQEAVPPGEGAMAALLKLPAGRLDAVLDEAAQGEIVSAANLNSPDQIVIAGHAAAVQRAIDLAKAAGARKAVLLPVSAPFHCALMKPAQQRLAVDLEAASFRDLACPLVNNWQARPVRTADEARQGLFEQVPNPVRWTESMQYLAGQGIGQFVEVGAGGVLTGLLRNLDPALKCVRFGEAEDLEKLHVAIG